MQTKDFFKHAKLAGNIALASSLLMAAAQVQAAPWAGTQSAAVSGYQYIQVGVSNVPFGPHSWGNAGIGISNFPLLGVTARVDFEGLTNDLTGPIYHLDFAITEAPETHDELGVFSFARAGDGDVWFGEWSENGNTVSGGTTYNGRQVYYHGDNADQSIPGSFSSPVQIKYNVTGINNQFSTVGVMAGEFEANFYGVYGTLTGDIQDTAGFIIDIGTAEISSSAAISGSGAVASDNSGTLATGGAISGNFFNNHDAVAGIIDFAGTQYDTAFGGQAQ
ncbi:hypothetical protein MPL1_06340 [Methylophaga lonarensis MPL]|uniref:Transferrin-binding protein B C-lobe/N-lobe beta barrel domain-containing protein n=1 Tax=Methylophaga lonarensis MPL TaxID=1286106 RepID=M7P156_9GAMM|nr:Slam-dependent surface lipoprotein [Methylophaga lonarensis]EMR13197.1 hypothetical protein MPL1_06340 [Methylophaga lonarensis MPL]